MVLWVATPFLLIAGFLGAFLSGARYGAPSKQELSGGSMATVAQAADPHASVANSQEMQECGEAKIIELSDANASQLLPLNKSQ